LVVRLDVVVCDSVLTCLDVEDERGSAAASAACRRAVRGARLQHHSTLPGCRAGREDRPMQGVAGRDRGARPSSGAPRSGCRGAALSWLRRCAAAVGLHPGSLAALVLWRAYLAAATPRAVQGVRGNARPAARPGPGATRTRSTWWDRRCWPTPAARATGRSGPSWPYQPTRCGAGSAGRPAAPSGCACRAPSARTSATRCCRPASRPARRWLTHYPRSARPQRPSCACSADRAALAHHRHARPRSASRPATQRLNTAQLAQPCPHGGDSLTTADSMTTHRSSDTVSFRGSTSSPNTSPSSSSNATVNTWRVWGARPAAYTGCTDGAGATPRHAVPDAEACLPPMTPTSSGCCAAACRSPVVSGASARLTSSGSSGRRRGRVGEPSH